MIGAEKVLVVGGGSGIGRAAAVALLARGGRVVVSGRRTAPLEELAVAHPNRAWPLVCDVSKEESRRTLIRRAIEFLGGLDGFVYSGGNLFTEPPGTVDEVKLRAQLEVSLIAPLLLTAQAIAALPPGGGVVLVSSNLAHQSLPTHAAYSSAKAGLLAGMKSLALAGAPRGVRVNSVLPGVVETDMMKEVIAAQRSELEAVHPLGRLGRPEDVAQAVIYLLTQSWTTGTELVVDGGALIRP